MSNFHEFPTAILENDHLRLEYLTTGGPRIVGLSFHGSPNLLADVPDISWDTSHGKYHPLGGHRLWTSPESVERTYIPDEAGLQIKEIPNGVELTGAQEAGSGVRKIMRIELDPVRPVVRLAHTITNGNPVPIGLAAWCITMFRQGGGVILPQPVGNTDAQGLLANRLLVLWPYTHLQDARLILRDDLILLHAQPTLPPVKVGISSTAGWLAYWLEGMLFRKSFDMHPTASYPDGGCNTEVYCGDRFVELETLGPLVSLEPGESTRHGETWVLSEGLDAPFLTSEVNILLDQSNDG